MKVESKQIKSVTIQNLENDLSSFEIELSCLKYFCCKTTAEYKPSNPKLETVLNDYKAFTLKQMRKPHVFQSTLVFDSVFYHWCPLLFI